MQLRVLTLHPSAVQCLITPERQTLQSAYCLRHQPKQHHWSHAHEAAQNRKGGNSIIDKG